MTVFLEHQENVILLHSANLKLLAGDIRLVLESLKPQGLRAVNESFDETVQIPRAGRFQSTHPRSLRSDRVQ